MKIGGKCLSGLLVLGLVATITSCGSANPTASPSAEPSAKIWKYSQETDDFGDVTTFLEASTTNSQGMKINLMFNCQSGKLTHGIMGLDADGNLIQWSTFSGDVKVDGVLSKGWKNSGFVTGMLNFDLDTREVIRRLSGHSTFSVKHIPANSSNGLIIFTMPITGLENEIHYLKEAGCKID